LGKMKPHESSGDIITSTGMSFYGDLNTPDDYTHLSTSVNPDAPRGEISISTLWNFLIR